MGLAGRKQKQVIQADPRNTAWINDKNNIGAKLLSSMGYVEPGSAEASGASDSEPKIGLAGWVPNKRLRAIPAAKSGMEGIGYRAAGPNAASDVGALPMSLGGLASASSTVFSRLGSKAALRFVSAGASNEVISRAKTEGGEFSGLLQRLNAASAAASEASTPRERSLEPGTSLSDQSGRYASTSAVDAVETKEHRRQRKRLRKMEKEKKRAAKEAKRTGKVAESSRVQAPITSGDESSEERKPVQQNKPFNPRMASRARHLASKRMLHTSEAALAEILGISPSAAASRNASRSASPFVSSSSFPATVAVTQATTIQSSTPNDDTAILITPQEVASKSKRKRKRDAEM